MKLQITNVTRCAGGNHYTFAVKVNDNGTATRRLSKDQFDELLDDVTREAAFAVLVRNYILAHPGQTLAQLKAGLLLEVWYV